MKKNTFKTVLMLLIMCIGKIAVSQGCQVNAGFVWSSQSPAIVVFDSSFASAGSSITNYFWNFGNGGGYMPGQSQMTYTYNQPGTYTVCLITQAQGFGQTCTDTFCTQVSLQATGNCNASFTSANQGNGTVQFIPAVTGTTAPVAYSWNFGDGTSSTQSNPIHTYSAPGNYTVCLSITDAAGCSDQYCRTVNVAGPAAPTNDQVCGAIGLFCNAPLGGTNVNATAENSALLPNCTQSYTNTAGVWYRFNSGQDSLFTVSLCNNTSFDTRLNIYTGTSCQQLTSCIASNDDACGFQSRVSFSASRNTDYFILVSGFASSSVGTFQISLSCDTAPATNNCQAAFTYQANCDTVQFINTSTGSFTSQTWLFNNTTDTSSSPTFVFGPNGQNYVMLTISGPNCQNTYSQIINASPCYSDTVCGTIFLDPNGNGTLDSNETGTSGYIIVDNRITIWADSLGHFEAPLADGFHSIRFCAPQGYIFTIPTALPTNPNGGNCATYDSVWISGGMNCGFNFGIQNTRIGICGMVYHDSNNNGAQDQGETGLPNIRVSLSGNGLIFTAFTGNTGHYCINVPAGNYSLSISGSYLNGSIISPTSISVPATTPGNQYPNNNFGVYFQPGTGDLALNITPHTTVTPGFPAWYDVDVFNQGPTPMSGTLTLYYETAYLRFDRANPAQNAHNAASGILNWNIGNLLPGQRRSFWIDFDGIIGIPLGASVYTLATFSPSAGFTDVNAANNTDTVHQIVVGSWDPNNKLVEPTGEGVEGYIEGTETLNYTINFQNTGTAPAVNVVLHDIFEEELDLSTLELLGGSHDYIFSLEGRNATWKFNQIMLPDSFSNEPESHGYVKFRVKPISGLNPGSAITNLANIFFDFNEPITTNTALNTIKLLSSASGSHLLENLQILPNPTSNIAIIRIENGLELRSLEIFNIQGRRVFYSEVSEESVQFNRAGLASGTYFIKVTDIQGRTRNGKLLVR